LGQAHICGNLDVGLGQAQICDGVKQVESYSKNSVIIKLYEHYKWNKKWSHFDYVTTNIKGIESTTFYYSAIHD
jgi:hypothetical protein